MKIRIAYLIIPVVIGLIASLTGFSLIWRLFILSLLLPVISLVWTYLVLRNIKVEVGNLPVVSQVGKDLESQLTLLNTSKIPRLMLSVNELTDIPTYFNHSMVNLMPERRLGLKSVFKLTRRGRYNLGQFRLTAGDPLGLFSAERTFGNPQSIVVYPNAQELPFFDPMHYTVLGFGPGRYISLQNSNNVAGIRDYISGDSLRHVHWRTTAHSSKLMVKVYEPDRTQNSAKNIWIVCDMHEAVHSGSGAQSTEEYAINLAASIAQKFIEPGWPVGLITRSEKAYYYPLETGSGHLERMFGALAVMKADGTLPLENLLNNEAGHFDLNAMTIIITPANNERLTRTLLQIKRQQGVVVLVWLDAGTFAENKVSSSIPAILQVNGIQVYPVRQGDDLEIALDSRKL